MRRLCSGGGSGSELCRGLRKVGAVSGAKQSAAARSRSSDDPFARVSALPGVEEAVTDARRAVDRLLGHKILRRRSAEVSTESALRGARASAALEGVEISLAELRGEAAAAATASDLDARPDAGGDQAVGGGSAGPVVQGALRVSAELGSLAETWRQAPRQVLARLHVLAAAGAVDPGDLGRPRSDETVVQDLLGLGPSPSAEQVAARLDTLSTLLTHPTGAPALVVGAIVHAELLTLRPFGWGDGIVARAAERLTFIERGLDPKSLTAPEVGHAELAGEYATALRAYQSAAPDGVVRWIRHCADATVAAARDSLAICEAFMRG